MVTLSSTASAARIPEWRPAAVAYEPDLRWDLLLLCLAGHILTAVGRIHQLFPVLEVLRPAMLTGLIAIGLYAFERSDARRPSEIFRMATTKSLLAFLAWMVMALPGALVVGNSLDLVLGSFVKTVAFFLLVVGAVRGIRDVERLAMVYVVAATVYAAVAITRFDLGSGDAWRLGHLYYYDANDLATFLVTAMPLGLYFLHNGRRTVTRVLALFALAVIAVAFVRTGSRGGFIALAAMTGFILLRYSAISLARRLAATVLISLVVIGTASDQYWSQMSTIGSDADYNRTDESGRMQIWNRGIGYMLRHPLLGVGPNNFQTAEGRLSPIAERQQFGVGVRWSAAHNTYIQVGAELGVIGLRLFLAFMARIFAALRSSRRAATTRADAQNRRRQLQQLLTASLIGFAVGAIFLSLAYTEMLYALAAMAVGLQKVAAAPDEETPVRGPLPWWAARETS